QRQEGRIVTLHMAYLAFYPCFAYQLYELLCLFHSVGQGLFYEDMLALMEAFFGQGIMGGGRCYDVYSFYGFNKIIDGGEALYAVLRDSAFRGTIIGVVEADERCTCH